jgi:hypothetical protein
VNGEDGSLVKTSQGVAESFSGFHGIRNPAKVLLQKGVVTFSVDKSFQGLAEFLPDTASQIFGGSFSVGNNQDLLDAEVFFKKKAENQTADGIGFTGSGTGINEIEALERILGKVKCAEPGGVIIFCGHNEKAVICLLVQENPVLRAGSEIAGSAGTINKA